MDKFIKICKECLVTWYNDNIPKESKVKTKNIYVVWSCKTLQNAKALLSTDIDGDGVYAEYTYNGEKNELYQDIYLKDSNKAIKASIDWR